MFKGFLAAFLALSACLSAYETECNGFTTFFDLLVWNAQESGAENWAQVFVSNGSSESVEVLDVPFDYNAGLRAGVAYAFDYDEWDLGLSYTWFHTSGKKGASTTGAIASSFLGNFYAENADGSSFGPSYKSTALQWAVLFNMFDLELGRKFWVGTKLYLRPFIEIKGGWINQKIRTKWKDPSKGSFTSATENLKNNFWGIGPGIGFQSKWIFACPFDCPLSLFGDFSSAIMWGHWTFADVYQNNKPDLITINIPNVNGGATTVRGLMGFGWEGDLRKVHYSIRLGYEMQFWLDQLQLYSLNTGRFDNELTLQGGVLDIRIDF